jgi:hypothetical protein
VLAAGCGGGGGSNSQPGGTTIPPGTSTPYYSRLSGSITDGNGGAIVGATVTLPGYPSVTSTQFGSYIIPNVEVNIGQTSLVAKLSASATVNGKPWSGQNTIEVIRGNALTENASLELSLTSAQGAISGRLTSNFTGNPLVNARVSIADGPYTGTSGSQSYQYFSLASSFNAYTDSNGSYTIAGLPPLSSNYTVTASFIGYINQTKSNVIVTSGATTSNVNFALAPSTTYTVPPAVTGLAALAITMPLVATREAADPQQTRGIQAIKLDLLQRMGYLKHRATDLTKATIKSAATTRSAPSGYMVESDVTWDYTQVNNLLGYDVLRSANVTTDFGSIALLLDPLGDRFADDDPTLTPGTTYYYSVARVDTIDFPVNGDEGPPSAAVAVLPLGAMSLSLPISGASVTGPPTFSWNAASGGSTYTVMVYSQFPNYQSDTDPNAVQPIWTATTSNLSQAYTGTTGLKSGQTYYWDVLCQDSAVADFSISPIQSFIEK